MSAFEELMASLNAIDAEQPEVMTKSFPDKGEDDKERVIPEKSSKEDSEEDEDEDEGEDMEKCSMTKSFANEDGEELIDATEIVTGLQKSFAEHEDILAKAMPKVVELLSAQSAQLKEQGDLIKSLQDSISAMGARSGGRKSTVTVMAKSQVSNEPTEEKPAITKETLMAKAMTLFGEHKLSSLQVNKLDVALRSGYAPDADVLAMLVK